MIETRQHGFTLVEIAIVLVIIGLLLGGILKGQELINSARVRNLAGQNSAVQAAYYGFLDRFRKIPGDWCATGGPDCATQAIGVAVNIGGDDNGRIDNTFREAAATWEQMNKANFLGGGFTPATAPPANDSEYRKTAPSNAFGGALVLTRNKGYTGTASERLNLHLGLNIPVNIARELDVKVDDGLPNTGILRLTKEDGSNSDFDGGIFAPRYAECTTTSTSDESGNPAGTNSDTDIYDIFDNSPDCGAVFIY